MTTPSAPGTTTALFQRLSAALGDIRSGSNVRARTQRDALLAFSVRVTSAAILYLSQIVLARWMGGFEYGLYVYVWTWVILLGGLSHGGLGMTMLRYAPEYTERSEDDLQRGLLYGGRVIAIGLSTGLALIAATALWVLGDPLTSPYGLPLMLAFVAVPMFALTEVQDGLGRGKAWMAAALLPPYVLRPLLLLAAMAAAYVAGLPPTAVTAVGAAIVATWASAIIQTLMIERRLAKTLPPGPRKLAVKTWLATSLPLLVIGGCEMILQSADVLVISRFMTPTDVAIYYAAAKTMALVLFVQYAVGSAVANRFAALNARGDMDGLDETVRDAVSWTFWPSLAAAIAILALGRPLLALFGPQFSNAYPVMFILVVGFLMRAAMGPAEYLLNMLGEQKRCARSLMIGAALGVVLNLTLVPLFGLVGAATATALAYVTAAVLNAREARRRLGRDVSILATFRSSRP